jgi:hypothetical protein
VTAILNTKSTLRKTLGVSLLVFALSVLAALPTPARGDHGPGPEAAHVHGNLKDIVSNLFGGDGITLNNTGMVNHSAHFTAQSLNGLGNLSNSLSSGLGFLSFNSSVAGYTIDLETGIPIEQTQGLGPLIAETPFTLGEKRVNFGFSFTQQEFTHFEGRKLSNQVLFFDHPDANNDGMLGGPGFEFELDRVQIDIDIEIEQQIYAFYLNYGLTDVWDVGIIVPFIHMKATARGVASIDDPTPMIPSPHSFGGAADHTISTTGGRTFGIGDVLLRTKYNFITDHEWMPATAFGAQIALPTGDADNLMGTDSTRVSALLIMAKKYGMFMPHINFGHDWVVQDHEQNSLRYVFGFDVNPTDTMTVAFDVLGRWEYDGDGIGDSPIDLALGTKLAVKEDMNVNVNVIVPANRDEGLRAAYTLIFGLELTF